MGKAGKAPGGWKASLAQVLKQHNGAKADGSVASYATQDKRSDVLFSSFKTLRELGYKLDSVEQFKGKHMEALAKHWEEKGLSPSTVQNNISIFRQFSSWIGKTGMVESSDKYVSAGVASRSSVAKEDKSWVGKGVDFREKLEEVRALDQRVALQLELQREFGLRAREAMELRPHLSDKGSYLAVNVGTKGGRDRVVEIRTDSQRDVLERAKAMAGTPGKSTSDPTKSLAQVKNHYYHVLRSCNITREAGYTSHGLRHEFAHLRYEQEAGVASPVRGGEAIDRDLDRAARLVVAEDLGHSREDVTTHYLGR